jgi:hypothetical protein
VKHQTGHSFWWDWLVYIGALKSALGFECFDVNQSVHYFAANFEIDWSSAFATVTFDGVD